MPLLLYWIPIVVKDKTPKRGCRWPAINNPHRWCTSWRSRGVRLPSTVQWLILYRGCKIAVISVSAPKYTCTNHWQGLFCSKVPKHRPSLSTTWIHWRLSAWCVSDWCMLVVSCFQCKDASASRNLVSWLSGKLLKLLPDPQGGLQGPTSNGREGRGRKRGQEGEGRDQEKGKWREGKGKEGRGKGQGWEGKFKGPGEWKAKG